MLKLQHKTNGDTFSTDSTKDIIFFSYSEPPDPKICHDGDGNEM